MEFDYVILLAAAAAATLILFDRLRLFSLARALVTFLLQANCLSSRTNTYVLLSIFIFAILHLI